MQTSNNVDENSFTPHIRYLNQYSRLCNIAKKATNEYYCTIARSAMNTHISLIRNVYEVSDEVLDVDCNNGNNLSSISERKNALRAITTIDKPNVHHLWEFTCTVLPMVDHARIVGELVFEKSHQSLKNISHSNNHDVQMFAMRHAAFDDWMALLCSLTANYGNQKE